MTIMNSIPFLDLATSHRELKDELCHVFGAALESTAFVGGQAVEDFERQFAHFCGAEYCVGVSSGTDALRFALLAAGIRPGEAVITVPNTFIATVEAITQCGAFPLFVDVDEQTSNMSPAKVDAFLATQCQIDSATRKAIHRGSGRIISAIVPVHLYGQMADMDPILDLAARYNLTVIEDACQAHGAEYFSAKDGRWHKGGSMGNAAAFSFYPGKNLGACGEAGAVTTNDSEVAHRIRIIRDHGQARKYYHQIEGYNGRLDAIQAGFLQVKLRHLAAWNEERRECANRYRELLGSIKGVGLPSEPSCCKSVYHLYVIQVNDRLGLQRHLNAEGIGTGIHYPVPLHLQEAYRGLGYQPSDFPVAVKKAAEILSLPMFPGLTYPQQVQIAEAVQCFMMPQTRMLTAAGD
jgi:dTDP-4-amino-4,6-dideoxygalactose transaminase